MAVKKIAIYLDGTWNTPESRTNVFTLFEETAGKKVGSDLAGPELSLSEKTHGLLIKPFTGRDIKREKLYEEYRHLKNESCLRYYDLGVGTRYFDRIRGGTLGRGVSENISQAYEFLCQVWEPGDELFIFGFSRGAYTARSLVGLLDLVGLISAEECKDRKKRKQLMDYLHQTIKYLHHQTLVQQGETSKKVNAPEKAAWMNNIPQERQTIPVRFLGVWDTVGALGVPERFKNIVSDMVLKPFTKTIYETLGNTEVCHNVEYAYHAMAIDEHRMDFQVTPWTYPPDSIASPPLLKEIQQQWFVGAHSNVGGGYNNNYLSEIPCCWIQEQAAKAGLVFHRLLKPRESVYQNSIVDSYSEFARGFHKRFNKPVKRLLSSHLGEKPGGVMGEAIHSSVWEYYRLNNQYRPENIPLEEVAANIHQQPGVQNEEAIV